MYTVPIASVTKGPQAGRVQKLGFCTAIMMSDIWPFVVTDGHSETTPSNGLEIVFNRRIVDVNAVNEAQTGSGGGS